MTSAIVGRGRSRVSDDPPRPRLSWTMMGVLLGAACTAGGAVSAYATLTDRVAHIEEQLPAGAIQRLDERTVQMQHALERIEARP